MSNREVEISQDDAQQKKLSENADMKKTVCEDVASKEVTRSYLLKISED